MASSPIETTEQSVQAVVESVLEEYGQQASDSQAVSGGDGTIDHVDGQADPSWTEKILTSVSPSREASTKKARKRMAAKTAIKHQASKDSSPPAKKARKVISKKMAPTSQKQSSGKQVAAKTTVASKPKTPKKSSKPSEPKAKKTKSPSKSSDKPRAERAANPAVWEGAPDEDVEGGWPEGWIKRKFKRIGGKSAGTLDRYWYSPGMNFKLRSMTEVKKFLAALRANNGDEAMAWKVLKNKT